MSTGGDDVDLFSQAQDALFGGDTAAAVALCKQALEVDEDDAEAHRFLCRLLLDSGRFDEALDAACDWGLNCGNSEPQLAAAVDAAFLCDNQDLLQAAAQQMCTCVVSDLLFAHTLALAADMRVSVESAAGGAAGGPRAAWGADSDGAGADSAPPTADGDTGGGPVLDEEDTEPLTAQRQDAYTAFAAARRAEAAAAPVDDGLTRLRALFASCHPQNACFVLALLVPLLLSVGRRAEAAEAVARAAEVAGGGSGGEAKGVDTDAAASDPNWLCCDALVAPQFADVSVVRSASAGACPIVRKRVLAALAAAPSK